MTDQNLFKADKQLQDMCGAEVVKNRAYLALGVPGEVQTVGLAGYWQYEGESIMIHHIVPHIVQLSIQTCKHTKELTSTDTHGGKRENQEKK